MALLLHMIGEQFVAEWADTNLKNKKPFVERVSGHGGLRTFVVWDVVSLDVHLHLLLLQIEQQLKLRHVILPTQWVFKQGPPEQIRRKKNEIAWQCVVIEVPYSISSSSCLPGESGGDHVFGCVCAGRNSVSHHIYTVYR